MAAMAQGWMLGAYYRPYRQHDEPGVLAIDLADAAGAVHHARGRMAADQNRR